jgi:hypothetical protein
LKTKGFHCKKIDVLGSKIYDPLELLKGQSGIEKCIEGLSNGEIITTILEKLLADGFENPCIKIIITY